MSGYINVNRGKVDMFGRNIFNEKNINDFSYLLNVDMNDIVLFQDGTEDIENAGKLILPRNYFIFVGTKNGELQFKPYEYNKYRIVVSTYNNIITSVDTLG